MSKDFRILVAVDLKTGTDQLLAETKRYGQALKAIVDIIHVVPQDPDFVDYIKNDNIEPDTRDAKANVMRTEHRNTQSIGATLRASGIRVDHTLTVQGPILATLLAHVRRFDSNLLMLGSHQHSALHRLWYGDTVTDAAKRAPCALLVVPIEPD